MFTATCAKIVPALVIGWLLAAATVVAADKPQVKDDAGFFTAETIKEANEIISAIKQKHKLDLLVETVKEPPEDRKAAFTGRDKGKAFHEWARERARAARVQGVYILICKDPGRIQVEVGDRTQKKAFTLANREELRKIMRENFEKKEFDKGLIAGVQYVQKKMADNLGKSAVPAPRQSSGETAGTAAADGRSAGERAGWSNIAGLICIGAVVVLGLWLIIGLIRSFTGGGGGSSGGGGGGFLTSLLGGLFGAAAGMWLYNHFFGGGASSAHAGSADSGMASNEDTDYSGAGDDFGDSSSDSGGDDFGSSGGGSDFGGGDYGGGDFGGGDFGGGGDF